MIFPPSSRRLVLGVTCSEIALALIVLGAHLVVFSYAGSPLPYYDQWVMEFNDTLMPIAAGNDFSTMFVRHNEHMMLTTKVLTLLGFFVNGYWDITFLTICSALIRALTALMAFRFISSDAESKTNLLLWFLCAFTFAAPYSGFNSLNGMQVCFYLADLALLWSLRATTEWNSPIAGGLALVSGSLFGVMSLASAVAIPACTLGAHLFQHRARRGFWAAWIISAVIALSFVFTGKNAAAVSAHNFQVDPAGAGRFWLQIISWPSNSALVGGMLIVFGAIMAVLVLRQKDWRTSANATLVGLGVYAVGNAAFIAINRDPSSWHMRHWETIALFPFAAVAFGLHLADRKAFRLPVLILLSTATLGYAFFAANLIRNVSWPYIETAHNNRSAALKYYRDILRRPDLNRESQRVEELMETDDHSFLDDPIGRYRLHPTVAKNIVTFRSQSLSMLSPALVGARGASWFSWFTDKVISSGWLFIMLGIILEFSAAHRDFSAAPEFPKK